MTNPFEVLLHEIQEIKAMLSVSPTLPAAPPIEIIDRKELCNRLDITVPTLIRWERKGKIPCFHVGSAVRYNWHKVIDALEKKNLK